MLRDQLGNIILGTVFVFIGLAAWSVAAVRRRSGVRILFWLGTWSAMYGAGLLAQSPAVVAALPHWIQISVPYVNVAISYLVVVVASLAWLELSLGKIRLFLQVVVMVSLAIALAGIGFFVFTGSTDKLMLYNNLLAVCLVFILLVVVSVPKLANKFLVLPTRGVLAAGTLFFAAQALYGNLGRPLHFRSPPIVGHLGFAVLLFSLGFVAVQKILAGERRLLTIENELRIARQLQFSILPTTVPEVEDVRIAAVYQPMTAVAGDFYEFLHVDRHRAGFLVADVSGHGVPAALIASMIKVAMQWVVARASEPQEVLRGLNRTLAGQLRGQFVTAAYLWLDTEIHRALYSAAGHPPLLRWRDGKLERIESNGLLFGVAPDSQYPVCDLPLNSGDRFLLYTDGVTEPENAVGDSFGDRKLEEVVRSNRSRPASELSNELLSEIRRWQPASMTQQDDITVIVIDCL